MQAVTRSRIERSLNEARRIKSSLATLLQGQKIRDDYRKDPVLFSEFVIGNPFSPLLAKEHPLLDYEKEILRERAKELFINKSSKIGITETILRDMTYRGTFGDCAGYQMLLGAQRRDLASRNLARLVKMFQASPDLWELVEVNPQRRRCI